MNVELYVYDLSRGLARQLSLSLLGTHIDAVYHTSLVFGGVEYFFGAGVQTSYPGLTHHGKPMEIVTLGRTELPMEIILEYLESLRTIYTMESYDLFLHNCNNFTQDFAMFLIGRSIPDRITSLPQTVLKTPFGQMLKPQLESAIRGVAQAPVPPDARPNVPSTTVSNGSMASSSPRYHRNNLVSNGKSVDTVHNITTVRELDELLIRAKNSCAVVFFTSATCPPCKIVYPAYDELAAEYTGKAVLIKVDLSRAYEIGSRYQVRATPTFVTFLRGEKENEWSGANESQLRGNVRMLVQMAHPPHPHSNLKLPSLQRLHEQPVIYTKMPPLDKLIKKLGALGTDPAINALKDFILARQVNGSAESPLPFLPDISKFIISSTETSDPEALFPIVDLFRLALVDARLSGYFAEEPSHVTVFTVLRCIVSLGDKCPYPLRIVGLQMACNLFTSSLFPPQLLSNSTLSALLIQLVTSSLLDTNHPPVCVAAASLAYNISTFNHSQRLRNDVDILPESAQVELIASLLEALGRKPENKDELRGILLSVGLLGYSIPTNGELANVCEALGAKGTVSGVKGLFHELDGLVAEVETVMK